MNEFFKKIGIPATVAGFAGAVVTAALFIFQVDTRYAKSEDVELAAKRTNDKIDALTTEVSRLAGSVQVLIAVSARSEKIAVERQQDRVPVDPMIENQVEKSSEVFADIASGVKDASDVPGFIKPASSNESVADMVKAAQADQQLVLKTPAVDLSKLSTQQIETADQEQLRKYLQQTSESIDTTRENVQRIREF